MKGGRCFLCDSLVETDNDDDLCNDCLSETSRTVPIGLAIILVAVIIVVLIILGVS